PACRTGAVAFRASDDRPPDALGRAGGDRDRRRLAHPPNDLTAMALPPDPARSRAERYGRWAETAAVVLLMCQGFRILGRRCRTPAGEIDIVARRGRLVVACEVKARR